MLSCVNCRRYSPPPPAPGLSRNSPTHTVDGIRYISCPVQDQGKRKPTLTLVDTKYIESPSARETFRASLRHTHTQFRLCGSLETSHILISSSCTSHILVPSSWTPHILIPSSWTSHILIPSSWTSHILVPSSWTPHILIPSSWTSHMLIPSSWTSHILIPSSWTNHILIPSSWTSHILIPSSWTSHILIPSSRTSHILIPSSRRRKRELEERGRKSIKSISTRRGASVPYVGCYDCRSPTYNLRLPIE